MFTSFTWNCYYCSNTFFFQVVNFDPNEVVDEEDLNINTNEIVNNEEFDSDKEDPGSPKVKPKANEVRFLHRKNYRYNPLLKRLL